MFHLYPQGAAATDPRFSSCACRECPAALVPEGCRSGGQTPLVGYLYGARFRTVDPLLLTLDRAASKGRQLKIRPPLRRAGCARTGPERRAAMKKQLPNLLGAIVRDYFTEHLPRVCGMSPHTIHSYRDTLALLLRFLSARSKRPVAELNLKDLDPPGILAFLSYLEQERKNGAATRTVRLSAIHALFRYVASRNPEHLDLAQRVLGIPFKRAPQRAIDYLEYEEIESILKAIDRTNLQGTRDYALLATMFNTGARVQEIADLRACDLQLTKPFQVKLFGKGKK